MRRSYEKGYVDTDELRWALKETEGRGGQRRGGQRRGGKVRASLGAEGDRREVRAEEGR